MNDLDYGFWMRGSNFMLVKRTNAVTDMCQILVAELLNRARRWRCGRIAEHADRGATHVLADVEQCIEVFFAAEAFFDAPQNLREPRRALATRRALSTRLVCIEVDHPTYCLDHARLIIHHDH